MNYSISFECALEKPFYSKSIILINSRFIRAPCLVGIVCPQMLLTSNLTGSNHHHDPDPKLTCAGPRLGQSSQRLRTEPSRWD